MNRDRLVGDAKEAALALVRGGYKAPAASWQEGAQTTQIKVLGEQFLAGAKLSLLFCRRLHHGLRRARRAQARQYPGRRATDIAATRQRAIRARPRARSLCLSLRRKENAGTHRLYAEDGQTAEELAAAAP